MNYSDRDGLNGMDSHMGLGLGYTSGALTVSANYGEFESTAGVKTDGWGAAVNYDLGGAAVQFGYGSENRNTGDASWSLGLAMSF